MIAARSTMILSDAATLMVCPTDQYRRRVNATTDTRWWQALIVPVLLAGMLGIVTSVAATGRVVWHLVVSQTVCWSFVPLLQLLTAALLVASAGRRPLSFARRVELLFAGHGPWSIWLVGIAAMQMLTPNQNLLLASTVAPALWTAWMLFVYCREVLALPWGRAAVGVLAHQAATMLLILAYVEFGSRLSVRLIGLIQR